MCVWYNEKAYDFLALFDLSSFFLNFSCKFFARCYIVLYCIVLYDMVSYHIVSHRMAWHRIVSHRIALYCTVLCIVLYFIVSYFSYRIVSYHIIYHIISYHISYILITTYMLSVWEGFHYTWLDHQTSFGRYLILADGNFIPYLEVKFLLEISWRLCIGKEESSSNLLNTFEELLKWSETPPCLSPGPNPV